MQISRQSRPTEDAVQGPERHRLLDDGAARSPASGLKGLDAVDIVGARHQDPVARGKLIGHGGIELSSIAVGQVYVANDHIGERAAGGKAVGDQLRFAERSARRDFMATALEILANFRPEVLVILDKKNPHRHSTRRQATSVAGEQHEVNA
jgi:hypothetical protein